MDLANGLCASDQSCSLAQLSWQRLRNVLVIEIGQKCVHDFANAFRVEIPELAIDRYSSTHMDSSKCRVANICLSLFRVCIVYLFRIRRRQHFQFVCRTVKMQGGCASSFVPFPLTKGYEARSAFKFFCVELNNVISMTP